MSDVPRNPYQVLVLALVLPGAGHVLLGLAPRGLIFLFFILVFGMVSLNLMPATSNFVVRHIGGIFIYGLSVIDAYKIARVKWEKWRYRRTTQQE